MICLVNRERIKQWHLGFIGDQGQYDGIYWKCLSKVPVKHYEDFTVYKYTFVFSNRKEPLIKHSAYTNTQELAELYIGIHYQFGWV